MYRLSLPISTVLLLPLLMGSGCDEEHRYARAFKIEHMAQTIGGPVAVARPGDYLLENDRIRAVIHGRHNQRSTVPVANGSLVDLDIQRPHLSSGAGRGKDAFYELTPLVNLKASKAINMTDGNRPVSGPCHQVGDAPCPSGNQRCVRITTEGGSDNLLGVLGLLDLAIEKKGFDNDRLVITTDYDVCPGESFVRITTTARFEEDDALEAVQMQEFSEPIGVLEVMLGEDSGIDCARQACPAGQECVDLLINLQFGGINMEMKRCRKPDHLAAGLLGADLTLFSGKVNVFVPGNGFDNDSLLRSRFDVGQDTFSSPMDTPFLGAVGDGVSYVYFNQGGLLMIPAFTEAFTAAMTSRYACPQSQPDCLAGKKVRYHRFAAVGHGDMASALTSLYKVQGLATGQIEGYVVDARTRRPVSGIDVYAFKVPAGWDRMSDREIADQTWINLIATHRQETRTDDNPDGDQGFISHFKTDVGLDRVLDGSFAGPLPLGATERRIGCASQGECRYILMAHAEGRPVSRLYPIRVRRGATTRLTLLAGESATLQYDVVDQTGRRLPCKLTIGHCFAECASDADCDKDQTCNTTSRICAPKGGYTVPESCRPDQRWDAVARTCTCRLTEGLVPLSLGGRRNADNTVKTVLSGSGTGQVQVEPGNYQVIVSRGFEYEISRHFVTLQPGMLHRLSAVLPRVVDSSGWISADFHAHGPNSLDSGLSHEKRIASYVAEGVEMITGTDHDHITDYAPTIFDMGLQDWITSQIGVEVSPLDYGHFIGFPLRFDDSAELNGSFHWRVHSPTSDPTLPDWELLVPAKIYSSLRELGTLGKRQTVVYVAHFYDHFHHFDLDPFTMNLPAFNLMALYNPVLQASKFSGEFDALEAFNGKQLDVVRRPTYKEAREYNVKLAQAIKDTRQMSYDKRQQTYLDLSIQAQLQFMVRTPEEQKLAIAYDNEHFQCRCATDEGCGSGAICDVDTGACTPSCQDDTHCDGTLVAAGREACQPKGDDPGRRTCQRLAQSCSQDEDCTTTFKGAAETCVGGTCQMGCSAAKDCKDPLRPVCDADSKRCVGITPAGDLDPCITIRGTIDDWFQLLNRGVYRTIMGNSDSHDTYGTEAGIPRNYVQSSSDLPQRIDIPEVASQVHAMHIFSTYGPFVELTLNGQPMGSTVTIQPGQSVSLALKIQSPLWFDVDRVEIYRNGELIQEITGRLDCTAGNMPCIRVPNNSVVNLDTTIVDTPDQDSWYVVIAMGVDGKSLAPVYSSTPVARLGMFEFIQRLTPLLPPLRSFGVPLAPSLTEARPYAVTNPVFVDLGGDGLKPVAPMPGWAPERDMVGKHSSTLKSSPHHDHSMGVGSATLRMDTQRFEQMISEGVITREALQKAVNQLRYLGSGF